MDRKKAIQIKAELLEFARKHGLWVDLQEVRTPDLKDILVIVKVRVTEK